MKDDQGNDNPIAMYLIVRDSLNMSQGKSCAQCAHGSQMITMKYFELKERSKILQKQLNPLLQPKPVGHELIQLKDEYAEMALKISIFGEWVNSGIRKIVLKADDKEWVKIKEEFKDDMVLVIDAGLTELAPNSQTIIALWPQFKSNVSKTIKRLQVLK